MGTNREEERRLELRPNIETILSAARHLPSASFPERVSTFIADYLEPLKPKSILDPCAGVGALLSSLTGVLEPESAIGVVRDAGEYEIAKLLHAESTITWKHGDPFLAVQETSGEFDAVVSSPPWGWRRREGTTEVDDDGAEHQLRDDGENLLMLSASRKLSPGGVGIFVLPASFAFRKSADGARENLHRFGLRVDSMISLPAGTFAPATQIESLIVFIRRGTGDELFVGELPDQQTSRQALLTNLVDKRDGPVPQLGVTVPALSFVSFRSLVAEREIERLAVRLQLPPVSLADIATAINRSSSASPEFEERANTVYLPLIGRSEAVTSRTEFKLKEHNYIQIVLDEDRAIAEYVAAFFGTPLGLKVRESLQSGTFIPKLTKATLQQAVIYLPPIEQQRDAVRVSTRLRDLGTDLERLTRALWSAPNAVSSVEKELQRFRDRDDLQTWMEELPFPVASILWVYFTEADQGRKLEQLLLFFEALAEFLVMELVSLLHSDQALFDETANDWVDSDEEHRMAVSRPTFGYWNVLGRRLTKVVRRLLSEKETRERARAAFGHPDDDFVEMLTDGRIFAALEDGANLRNKKAHGGITSSDELQAMLVESEAVLSRLREAISDRHGQTMLLRASTSEFDAGVFAYSVEVLMGTRTPFRRTQTSTLTPLDKNRLYLAHSEQLAPTEVVPLVRMMSAPKTRQDACYFYNRIQGTDTRWVSYHFDKEAEVLEPTEPMRSVLELLRGAS